MSKKIVDENGNTYVQKKPFYKRVWFWIVVVILVLIVGGSIGGSKSNDDTLKTSTSKSSSAKPKGTAQQLAALASAKNYATTMHMSKQGIYDQLTSQAGEKFDTADAQFAIDHVQADWNKNALEAAKNYRKTMNMSNDGIKQQLTSSAGDKFTDAEAQYAVDNLPK